LVKGAFFYDPCIKVPLIVRWPQAKRGLRTTHLVQLHDLAATILSAAGVLQEDLQQTMPESRDLASLIQRADEAVHEFAICCYRNTGISDQGIYWDPPIHATMIRDERYKLNVYHADSVSHRELQGELYDLIEDKQELNNLWDNPNYRDIRMKMTEKLLDWIFTKELQTGSRGGEAIPDPSQKLVNALKQ
jgi:arylsulfatase A-like enzyme